MSSQLSSRRDAEAHLDVMIDDYDKSLSLRTRPSLFDRTPLRSAIAASPDLRERLVDAIEAGSLDRFANESLDAGAKAEYRGRDRTIVVPAAALADRHDLIFVLGHETGHANRDVGVNYRDEVLRRQAETISGGPPPHDYTDAVFNFVEHTRREEAHAHIGGFNAVVSALAVDGREPTPQALYLYDPQRMRDFIEVRGEGNARTYQMKTGLVQERDGTLSAELGNVEAMKNYYADKMPGTFGENGLLNYRHDAALDGWHVAHGVEMHAAAEAVDATFEAEKGRPHPDDILNDDGSVMFKVHVDPEAEKPRIARRDRAQIDYAIDFARLGLDPALVDVSRVAPDGRTITVAHPYLAGGQRDTFDPLRSQVVVDRDRALAVLSRPSPNPDARVEASSSRSASSSTEVDAGPRRGGDLPESSSRTTTTTTSTTSSSTSRPASAAADADPTRSPLYVQATERLAALDLPALREREPLRNVAASLAVAAQRNGMTAIDHLVLGADSRVFALQGDQDAITARRAHVDVDTAVFRPAHQSLAQLQADATPTPSVGDPARQTHPSGGLQHH